MIEPAVERKINDVHIFFHENFRMYSSNIHDTKRQSWLHDSLKPHERIFFWINA